MKIKYAFFLLKNKLLIIGLIIIGIGFLGIIFSILNIQETEHNEPLKIIKLDMKTTEEYPKINLPEWDPENEIVWQENRPLTLNDFTGEVYDVEQPQASAQTNSGTLVHTTQGILDKETCYYIFTEINVGAIFTKEKSWIKPMFIQTT